MLFPFLWIVSIPVTLFWLLRIILAVASLFRPATWMTSSLLCFISVTVNSVIIWHFSVGITIALMGPLPSAWTSTCRMIVLTSACTVIPGPAASLLTGMVMISFITHVWGGILRGVRFIITMRWLLLAIHQLVLLSFLWNISFSSNQRRHWHIWMTEISPLQWR